MNYFKNFLLKNKHFCLLLFFIPSLIGFNFCEKNLIPKYIMHTTLDDNIPFIKEFIIPYVLWYAYLGYVIIYLGVNSVKDYYKLFIFIIGGAVICYILFFLFPTEQDLRPLITQNDIFSNIIKFIYKTDTPTNVCPSIHVYSSLAANIVLCNTSRFKIKKSHTIISSIIMITICLSTIFIKQHSIIDFICGILLALIFYTAVYIIPNVKQGAYEYNNTTVEN